MYLRQRRWRTMLLLTLLGIGSGCTNRATQGGPSAGRGGPIPTPIVTELTASVNAAPLAENWHAQPGRFLRSTPAVANGTVYLAMEDSCICALNTQGGHILWQRDPPGTSLASPVVSGDQVYVAVSHYHTSFTDTTRITDMYAYDVRTGVIHWHYPLSNVKDEYMAAPAVRDGVLYIGSGWVDYTANGGTSGHVTALDAQTGKRLWQRSTPGGMDGGVAVDDERVYFSNGRDLKYDQDSLYAVDRKTKKELWEQTFDLDINNPVTVADNTVYATGTSQFYGNSVGHLVALNAADGQVRWTLPITGSHFSNPVVDNSLVYIMQNQVRDRCIDNCGPPKTYKDYLLVLNAATGAIKTRMAIDLDQFGVYAFARYQNRLYYSKGYPDTAIQAIDMQTLQISQVFATEKSLWPGLAPTADGLFFGTFDGEIYSLQMGK